MQLGVPGEDPRIIRFGVFELDLQAGELRKHGIKIKLQEQPLRLLAMLLERPGEVVSRQQLQERLWSSDTFVDFEHSLNAAVKKLRQALGDSADNPRLVETLAKRGYRFVAPVGGPVNQATDVARASISQLPPPASEMGIDNPTLGRLQKREVFAWTLLGATMFALAVLTAAYFRERQDEARIVRFRVPVPDGVSLAPESPVVSPDGRRLVFADTASDKSRLWVHSFDSLTSQMLPGTEDVGFPFWSPDSRFLAFVTPDWKLKKIDVTNGVTQMICQADDFGGGTWSRDSIILFSQSKSSQGRSLYRVSASGGQPEPVLPIDKERRWAEMPQFLPDGRHFLYRSLARPSGAENGAVYLGSLDSKETRMLIPVASNVVYVPPGFLIFGRGHTLLAQRFDARKLQLRGEPFPVVGDVERLQDDNYSLFSASENGVLAYISPALRNAQLAWYGRDGKRLGSIGEQGEYEDISISPDETRVAGDGRNGIWTADLSTGIFTRVTVRVSSPRFPAWSPDGRELVFSGDGAGPRTALYRKVVGGGDEELLFDSIDFKYAQEWLRDRSILFLAYDIQSNTFYRLPLSGERKPVLLLRTGPKTALRVSPDGRWVAYQSLQESGSGSLAQLAVYIAAFPTFGEERKVSDKGGYSPLWRRDGNELFYRTVDGKLMSVDVSRGAELHTRVPTVLFHGGGNEVEYCASGDGKKFIILERQREGTESINVVLNWPAGVKR
jgi:DNA-binding winged helix-turn-helix (wHTH) protein/Tol biopolymer transport system component